MDTAAATPRHQPASISSHLDITNPIPSSSPAFGTPAFPIQPRRKAQNNEASNVSKLKFQAPKPSSTILPVILPPQTLRPIAFRTITKKHNLTLTSPALAQLATFVGKFCGSGWREEGLAERVLDDVAKTWKRNGGGILLEDGKDKVLTRLLRSLEECMEGGRIIEAKRANSATTRPNGMSREDSQTSMGMSALDVSDSEEVASDDETSLKVEADTRTHLRIISTLSQPRLHYNVSKKLFEPNTNAPSFLPSPSHKTSFFRSRYHLIHQRLMRMESFQTPTFAATAKGRIPSLQRSASSVITTQQAYKITPIANLLGRSGTQHLLLGLLGAATTGELAITDLTGSILVDMSEASLQPQDSLWACPGMIVLIEGVYDEDAGNHGSGRGGVGGVIGGRFVAITVTGPPCERRDVTLGIMSKEGENLKHSSTGFGWVDFLGVGSEKAIGDKMRRLERITLGRPGHSAESSKFGRRKMAMLGEMLLDNPRVLEALRKILASYAAGPPEEVPLSFVLMGNFVSNPSMGGGTGGGSIEYKEHFDSLASVVAEFSSILSTTTFVFVPGDNDPWPSAFSAGAATPIPREGVPDLFTSRIRRAFTNANNESGRGEGGGEAVWATNPARLSLFGPVHEVVLFRDDISSRFQRTAVLFNNHEPEAAGEAEQTAREDAEISEDGDVARPMELDSDITQAVSHQPQLQQAQSDVSENTSAATTTRKLVKTLVDQAFLSPFPTSIRPVHWDYASSLHLYPLPTSLVLTDAEAPPFAVSYEGCHVMNPGRVIDESGSVGGKKGVARWIEYDVRIKRGSVRELRF
ncbi:putative dna polymerase epsilon subunit [Phaeomoniella chlamydospora]|uniref:DNA polymerase epsilon subunit B n=1 Tax=Phaeomoniella chlamydospora TaxID=158046 RepID=A0A0G2H2K4_PHACM|nr:putative dna polymerase epsilon subunit [Phaeomoniella chlamydospora]